MRHKEYVILTKIANETHMAQQLLGDSTRQEFTENEMQKRAIAMTVINIGELVKNVSSDTREQYPNIPWKQAAGFRDIAAHKYQTLNMGDVYDTVKNDFPEFEKQIREILSAETDDKE